MESLDGPRGGTFQSETDAGGTHDESVSFFPSEGAKHSVHVGPPSSVPLDDVSSASRVFDEFKRPVSLEEKRNCPQAGTCIGKKQQN